MKHIKLFERKEKDAVKDKLLDTIAFGNEREFNILLNKRFYKDKSFGNLQTINFKTDDNLTPLLCAIHHNRFNILKKLIDFGANVNYADDNGFTPLMGAATENNLTYLQLLIDNGAKWNKKDLSNYDFFNYITDEYKKIIIEDYPEKYKDYLMRKDAEKYNL
jgi:ankyrin repeat protein